MQVFQALDRPLFRSGVPLPGEVIYLAADHAGRARCLGQFLTAGHSRCGRVCVGQQLESQRLQGIAGQDRHRLPELLVTRRLAAAGVVVVHGR